MLLALLPPLLEILHTGDAKMHDSPSQIWSPSKAVDQGISQAFKLPEDSLSAVSGDLAQ